MIEIEQFEHVHRAPLSLLPSTHAFTHTLEYLDILAVTDPLQLLSHEYSYARVFEFDALGVTVML